MLMRKESVEMNRKDRAVSVPGAVDRLATLKSGLGCPSVSTPGIRTTSKMASEIKI